MLLTSLLIFFVCVLPFLELFAVLYLAHSLPMPVLAAWLTGTALGGFVLLAVSIRSREGLKTTHLTTRAASSTLPLITDSNAKIFAGFLLFLPGPVSDAIAITLLVPSTRVVGDQILRRSIRKIVRSKGEEEAYEIVSTSTASRDTAPRRIPRGRGRAIARPTPVHDADFEVGSDRSS